MQHYHNVLSLTLATSASCRRGGVSPRCTLEPLNVYSNYTPPYFYRNSMQNEVKSEQPVDNSTTDISVQLQEVDALISATRRELSSSSLIGFTDTYLSHLMESKRPEFHREIMSRLENPTARELFIAPRGFAKSTICSRFYPLWLACYGKKKDIFLVSATISLAKENLRIIRQELENNEKLIADFGDLKSEKLLFA